MKRAVLTALAMALAMVVSAGAFAQEGLHPSKLDPSWKGLPFGGTRDQVLEILKKRIADRYGAMIRETLDVRDRDRLGREMQKEIDDIQASRIVFDGAQTGWNVSILQDEFVNGMGIEMTLVREGNARYYLFFLGGALFKMIETPQDPAREAQFKALEAAYGKASKVEYDGGKKNPHLDRAEWNEAGPLSLLLQDRTRQFQTVMIRWALKEKDAAVQDEIKKRAATGPALNPLIKAAQEAPEVEAKDPVDDLIGKPGAVPKVTDHPKAKKKPKK